MTECRSPAYPSSMPTLSPRPPVFTPEKVEKRPRTPHGPGLGGEPPFRKRTGDGGGGGDDDFLRGRGPREHLRRSRPAVLFFLLGDASAFLTVALLFLNGRGSWHFDHGQIVSNWRAVPIPPLLWLNTAVLLLSSLTLETARRRIFVETDVMDEWLGLGRPAARRALPWLISTWLLGLLFLAGQWTAWLQLNLRRGYLAIYQDAAAGLSFYRMFTAFHAAHLVVALAGLAACVAVLLRGRKLQTRQIWLDSATWFWHFLTVGWCALFALLVYAQ